MMADVPTIMLQMATDTARIQQDMQKVKSIIGDAMSQVTRSIDAAKSALTAMGVALSVSGLVAMIRSTIDAADKLNDLSERLTKLEARAGDGPQNT